MNLRRYLVAGREAAAFDYFQIADLARRVDGHLGARLTARRRQARRRLRRWDLALDIITLNGRI